MYGKNLEFIFQPPPKSARKLAIYESWRLRLGGQLSVGLAITGSGSVDYTQGDAAALLGVWQRGEKNSCVFYRC